MFRGSSPCGRFGQRIRNLTGLRKSFAFRVLYVFKRLNQHRRIKNLTGLRNSLAPRVLYVFKRFNQHRHRWDLSGLNDVAYRVWNLTGLRKSFAFRVLYVFKRLNLHRCVWDLSGLDGWRIAYETWQVFAKVLRSEFYMYSNDSICIISYETCQVWMR